MTFGRLYSEDMSQSLTHRHLIWRYAVFSIAGVVILLLAMICFAGTYGGREDRSNGISTGSYVHGWPWLFGGRYDDERCTRFLFWHGYFSYWSWLGLAGDITVFGLVTVLSYLGASRIARAAAPRFSLRSWLVLLTGICCSVAWWKTSCDRGLAQLEMEDRLQDQGCSLGGEFRPPRWLTRLTGSPRIAGTCFYRVTETLEIGQGSSFDPVAVKSLLNEQTISQVNVKPWAKSRDVRAMMNYSPFGDIEKLTFHGTSNTDDALAEVQRCVNLRELQLYYTDVGDQGVQRVAKCQRLENLEMYFTEATNDGLRELENLRSLKKLIIDGENVSESALDRLRAHGVEIIRF